MPPNILWDDATEDRVAYHAHYWNQLQEALGLTEQFCPRCGQWSPPGTHICYSKPV